MKQLKKKKGQKKKLGQLITRENVILENSHVKCIATIISQESQALPEMRYHCLPFRIADIDIPDYGKYESM